MHFERTLRTGIITEPTAAHLNFYLRMIAACNGLGPIAYADATGASFAQACLELPDMEVYDSPRRMLDEFRPDFVIVLLEAAHGPIWIDAALRANCHVLSEKHPASDIGKYMPLVAEAEARKRHLVLAFTNRSHPAVQKACSLLASGNMGPLYAADLIIIADQNRLHDPNYQHSWRADRSRAGGGILMALGIHHIDLLLWLTGASVTNVFAITGNVGGAPVDIEDAAIACLRLSNGATATLHAGFYLDESYQSQLTLWMSNGWLKLNFIEETQLTWYSTQSAGIQTWTADSGVAGEEAALFFQEIIDSIRFGGEPVMTPGYTLHVLDTVFAIYTSARDGRSVLPGFGNSSMLRTSERICAGRAKNEHGTSGLR